MKLFTLNKLFFFACTLSTLLSFNSALLAQRSVVPDTFREIPPLSEINHPVSTTNPEAQKHFDLGLANIFAFNHDLAFLEFEKAAQADPNLAMAYWGMALALGQNINSDVTPENELRAYNYIQKALTMLSGASPVEQDYIKALSTRYTNDPKADLIPLRYHYRDAMREVSSKYPEDLDAATIYAESMLDINPWQYWTLDGKPEEGTYQIIDLLESILRRNPYHIGANHYNIHAWEESPTPERALLSAYLLTKLFNSSGHLTHMPNHIFVLCGYYDDAVRTSLKAIHADHEYIKQYGMDGDYPLHYLSHNYVVLVRVYMLSEDYKNAIQTANELIKFQSPYYQKMPHLAKFLTAAMEVNLFFEKWKEILEMPLPPVKSGFVLTYWHFSRAMAYLNLNDKANYEKEKQLMYDAEKLITPEEEIANNYATDIFKLETFVLDAEVARIEKRDADYIGLLKKAIAIQDTFLYDEPPAWYMPIRMELGEVLLQKKEYKEAEAVFRKALSELQRNPRLLRGLALSLRGQGRNWDAFWVEREAKDEG